ncbi:MAG: acetylxylan esterase [Firmicutes bacterium]|nr:acetylxylan esterase [Bacillota bacterium]
MPWFDLDIEALKDYRTKVIEPDDFDSFWSEMKDLAYQAIEPTELTPYKEQLYSPMLRIYDVTFSGAHGDPIRAWYIKPKEYDSCLPLIINFAGYGGGRGLPVENLSYGALGFATFIMDTRGQGSSWRTGDTGDPEHGGQGPSYPGFMTRGISDRRKYYFTRLYIDAVRAVEEACKLDDIDQTKVFLSGRSQGGALSLAAAALGSVDIKACVAEVPFLADFPRAIGIGSYPYKEIADFLSQHVEMVEKVFNTLSYIDTAILARRIKTSCLLTVGLMDDIAPPSSVYAVYNEIKSQKKLEVYPFSGHEMPSLQQEKSMEFIKEHL